MQWRKIIAALAALGLTSCAAVRSTPVEFASNSVGNGLVYAMPKGVFRIQLINDSGNLELSVSQPFFVGDPNATYLLESSSGLLADQQYLFVVQPQTRLLSYVSSSSHGQAGQILQNLASSVAGVQTGLRPRELRGSIALPAGVIYSRIVDPFDEGCRFGETRCNLTSISQALTVAARDFACSADAPGSQSQGQARRELCASIERSIGNPSGAQTNGEPFFQISLVPMFSVEPRAAAQGASPNACRRSICYRAPLPYTLSVNVGGRTNVAQIVSLPNEAPVMSVSMPAGVFATSRARMELYQGMPARYVVDRHNELVAVTLLPLELVRAGFNTIAEVVKLRIDYNSNQLRELQSERNIQQQQQSQQPAEPSPTDSYEARASEPWEDNYPQTPPPSAAVTQNTEGSALPADILFTIPLSGSGTVTSSDSSQP